MELLGLNQAACLLPRHVTAHSRKCDNEYASSAVLDIPQVQALVFVLAKTGIPSGSGATAGICQRFSNLLRDRLSSLLSQPELDKGIPFLYQ